MRRKLHLGSSAKRCCWPHHSGPRHTSTCTRVPSAHPLHGARALFAPRTPRTRPGDRGDSPGSSAAGAPTSSSCGAPQETARRSPSARFLVPSHGPLPHREPSCHPQRAEPLHCTLLAHFVAHSRDSLCTNSLSYSSAPGPCLRRYRPHSGSCSGGLATLLQYRSLSAASAALHQRAAM